MFRISYKKLMLSLLLLSGCCNAFAHGVQPETSVVIVEQSDGEGAMNVKNTDDFPVLLLTTLSDIADDKETLLTITPPAARIEGQKSQRVRFILTTKEPLKTERLKRVIFEGVPPEKKGQSQLRFNIRQDLPVIIRPAGLEKDLSPWKRLSWKVEGDKLKVSNDSPYVVRLDQGVTTLPDNNHWLLPNTYVLPGQSYTLSAEGKKKAGAATSVRISPATTWGYNVATYDAPLAH